MYVPCTDLTEARKKLYFSELFTHHPLVWSHDCEHAQYPSSLHRVFFGESKTSCVIGEFFNVIFFSMKLSLIIRWILVILGLLIWNFCFASGSYSGGDGFAWLVNLIFLAIWVCFYFLLLFFFQITLFLKTIFQNSAEYQLSWIGSMRIAIIGLFIWSILLVIWYWIVEFVSNFDVWYRFLFEALLYFPITIALSNIITPVLSFLLFYLLLRRSHAWIFPNVYKKLSLYSTILAPLWILPFLVFKIPLFESFWAFSFLNSLLGLFVLLFGVLISFYTFSAQKLFRSLEVIFWLPILLIFCFFLWKFVFIM